jgi:hypothetical protein
VAAARLVRQPHWRGQLLDLAALAAQELGHSDRPKRLEAAWKAAPTLARLVRWLAAGDTRGESIRHKAVRAMAACPKNCPHADHEEWPKSLGFRRMCSTEKPSPRFAKSAEPPNPALGYTYDRGEVAERLKAAACQPTEFLPVVLHFRPNS